MQEFYSGSGLYDQSFSEGVIDSMDFDYFSSYIYKDDKLKWWCIDGGTQLVPEAMNAKLKRPLRKEDLGKRVSKIAYDLEDEEKPSKDKGKPPMQVKVNGEAETRRYMTVFATPTLACLQRMDLTGLGLLYEQKDALRSLHYDTASKVGMKFDHAWWIEWGIQGGLGTTDMPLRTCVYPSYNLGDPTNEPAVLLCSYSWSQDAARIGSLMKGDWKEETELKELLLNNLTWLHLEHAKKKRFRLDIRRSIQKAQRIVHHASRFRLAQPRVLLRCILQIWPRSILQPVLRPHLPHRGQPLPFRRRGREWAPRLDCRRARQRAPGRHQFLETLQSQEVRGKASDHRMAEARAG